MTDGLGSLRQMYRIGVGPSSSHSMGPRRAAELYRRRVPHAARYRVTLYGSLAETGLGHMTDRAVSEALAPAPCEIAAVADASAFRHPNAMRFEALDAAGNASAAWVVFSVGGGAIEDETGPLDELPPVRYPVADIAGALDWCLRRNKPFWALPGEFEPDVWDWLSDVWRAMGDAVRRGLDTEECVLPGGLELPRKAGAAAARARNLSGVTRDLGLISAYALAVSEENAAGGVVVTAPTCGAAGILPAILRYFSHDQHDSDRQILRALATAALFGAVVKTNASISGAEVGCQGEVGAGCAMAAAAAAQIMGGSPPQIEYAAEMAMEHHLGLTCDPVLGLVQIPCIERNAIAATRALDSAAYALLGDGRHTISFDEAVQVMYQTGRDLQSAYRETARGGLAEIWRRKRDRAAGKSTT